MRSWLIAVLVLAVPAGAGATAACPQLAWSDAKTAAPAPADIALLQCWSAAGDPTAGFMLAMLTKAGRGVPADAAGARSALLALAKGSDADIMRGALSSRTFGYTINDSSQAERAVDVPPYAPAQRELAKMLLLGQGGDRDIGNAKSWLVKARDKDKEAGLLLKALEAKGY